MSATRRTALAASLLGLASCTFANGPTIAESPASKLPQGRGRIYVYRPYNYIGSAATPTVMINDLPVGQAKLVGAFYCDLAPGRYVVSGTTSGWTSNPIPINISAGQSVYMRMGPTLIQLEFEVTEPGVAASEIASMHLMTAACPPVNEEKPANVAPAVDDVLAHGSAAEESGDFAAALVIYTDALQKYVTRLETMPDVVDRSIDAAIRMHPAPPIPEAAKKHAAAAQVAIMNASTKADLARARREYLDCLARAPWWSDVWFNLAKLDEQTGSAADVRRDLTWYLRAAPDAPDRAAIEKKISASRAN